MATADQVRGVLRTTWHRVADDCALRPAGIGAAEWSVPVGGEPYVARIVPVGQRAAFEAGLAVAAYLARYGPVDTVLRTVDGALLGTVGDEVIAVLREVAGRPLDPTDPVDQQWWGDALGAAHHRLAGFGHPGMARFPALRPEAAHLGIADWVRPAVQDAVAALRRLTVTDQLTYGVLHGDPGPHVFRLDPATGRLGLVDWGPVASGPLTYDLAAAVAYGGGPEAARDLVEAYIAAGPVPREEIESALPTMLVYRWAVYADHFARRLSAARGARPAGGAADDDPDRAGLEAARRALVGCGGPEK